MAISDKVMISPGLLLVLLTVLLCLHGSQAQCPPRCQCFGTRVRCMFLQMETIPQVPPETTILDLRFNVIKEIPRGALRGMQRLDTLLLNNNELERIGDGSFDGLHDIRYLHLYENKITEIEPKAFKNLHNLEQLSLHRNNITHLPRGLFTFNKKLKRLRLDSNALVCDCEMVWLAKMLRENLANTQAAATCSQPRALQGRSLMEIETSEFDCKGPEFLTTPSDVQAVLGDTVDLQCAVTGNPAPSVTWTLNGRALRLNSRISIVGGGLHIISVRDEDSGEYRCRAENKNQT